MDIRLERNHLKSIQRMMAKAFLPEYLAAARDKYKKLMKISRRAHMTAAAIFCVSAACVVAGPVSLFAFGGSVMTAAVLTVGGFAGFLLSTPFSNLSEIARDLVTLKARRSMNADIRSGSLLPRYQAEILPAQQQTVPAREKLLLDKLSALTPDGLKSAFDQAAGRLPVKKWIASLWRKKPAVG